MLGVEGRCPTYPQCSTVSIPPLNNHPRFKNEPSDILMSRSEFLLVFGGFWFIFFGVFSVLGGLEGVFRALVSLIFCIRPRFSHLFSMPHSSILEVRHGLHIGALTPLDSLLRGLGILVLHKRQLMCLGGLRISMPPSACNWDDSWVVYACAYQLDSE